MALVDIIIIGLLTLMLLIGLKKGFVKQAFSLIAWGAAVVVPLFFYGPVTKIVAGDVDPIPFSTTAIVFVSMFVVTFVVVKIIGSIFKKNIHKTALGVIDRLLGAGWGLARAIIIISLAFLAMDWLSGLPLIGDTITNFVNNNITVESSIGIGKYLYENNLLLKLMGLLNISDLPLDLNF